MKMHKPNQYAWLWWVSILVLSVGIAIFILLGSDRDYTQARALSIVVPIMITGLCIIIGTSKRWFGKGL